MWPDHLRSQTPDSLATLWPDLPLDPSIARRVIARVTGEGRDDLVGLRGLSHALAAEIARRGSTKRLDCVDRRESALDGFVKYLFRAADGAFIESVRIPLHRPRFSVCVSSQAGCGLGCAFCETGRLGFVRNLEPWEIVEQVLAVKRDAPPERPITGVVFQGQGEPLQNYDAVIRAATILRDPSGLKIRGEAITISTVGLLPAIERYTDEGARLPPDPFPHLRHRRQARDARSFSREILRRQIGGRDAEARSSARRPCAPGLGLDVRRQQRRG